MHLPKLTCKKRFNKMVLNPQSVLICQKFWVIQIKKFIVWIVFTEYWICLHSFKPRAFKSTTVIMLFSKEHLLLISTRMGYIKKKMKLFEGLTFWFSTTIQFCVGKSKLKPNQNVLVLSWKSVWWIPIVNNEVKVNVLCVIISTILFWVQMERHF